MYMQYKYITFQIVVKFKNDTHRITKIQTNPIITRLHCEILNIDHHESMQKGPFR